MPINWFGERSQMAPKIASFLFPLSFDWCGLFICRNLKICRQTMCSLQTLPRRQQPSVVHREMFRATGCQPLWSAGQLWATPQAGQQKCPLLCLQQCWADFRALQVHHLSLWKSLLNSPREYPLGKPWWLRSFSVLIWPFDRIQQGRRGSDRTPIFKN